ncbi:MAG TPA: hypothetical protein VGK81_05925 [Anaerolineae bacterium]
MPRLDEHADYVIKILGHIDETLVDWFGPLNIASDAEEGGQLTATLSGIVTDQAGLLGLIRHLHGLGIVLLSVERIARQQQ